MDKHPLTPMTDPQHPPLAQAAEQGEVGLVTLDTVRAGPEALAGAFEAERNWSSPTWWPTAT
jgi:3-dehydrotetronate 4-kinase